MRLCLILCAFGFHKWRLYDYHWNYDIAGRQWPMQSSRRKCIRCDERQDFNRLRGMMPYPQSEWQTIPRVLPPEENAT